MQQLTLKFFFFYKSRNQGDIIWKGVDVNDKYLCVTVFGT